MADEQVAFGDEGGGEAREARDVDLGLRGVARYYVVFLVMARVVRDGASAEGH